MTSILKQMLAPAPEVQFLPTIFRRIQQGDIRMPAFQRGFAWKDGQVLELLESIYSGYPIGSVLLWRVNEKVLRVEQPRRSYFPEVEERYPTHFVLDGLQRLSSLYAVFHFNATLHPDRFHIHFNPRNQRFVYARDSKPETIPLNVVFRPGEFVSYHTKLKAMENGDRLVNAAVALLSTFQEYLLPLVTIVGRDVKDVVAIFERINNTGTKFGAVDFMRAVTWSERFDLSTQLVPLVRSPTKFERRLNERY
ncbi:MAG TPA: DUF262 domain-containing protein [Polyangiaceae bacterium]|nr:DUF262 domain-containing protein [Polyangiaceae bacterium]